MFSVDRVFGTVTDHPRDQWKLNAVIAIGLITFISKLATLLVAALKKD